MLRVAPEMTAGDCHHTQSAFTYSLAMIASAEKSLVDEPLLLQPVDLVGDIS